MNWGEKYQKGDKLVYIGPEGDKFQKGRTYTVEGLDHMEDYDHDVDWCIMIRFVEMVTCWQGFALINFKRLEDIRDEKINQIL